MAKRSVILLQRLARMPNLLIPRQDETGVCFRVDSANSGAYPRLVLNNSWLPVRRGPIGPHSLRYDATSGRLGTLTWRGKIFLATTLNVFMLTVLMLSVWGVEAAAR